MNGNGKIMAAVGALVLGLLGWIMTSLSGVQAESGRLRERVSATETAIPLLHSDLDRRLAGIEAAVMKNQAVLLEIVGRLP